jgi:hypothetical protein
MSKNSISVLIYHYHKLVDLFYDLLYSHDMRITKIKTRKRFPSLSFYIIHYVSIVLHSGICYLLHPRNMQPAAQYLLSSLVTMVGFRFKGFVYRIISWVREFVGRCFSGWTACRSNHQINPPVKFLRIDVVMTSRQAKW